MPRDFNGQLTIPAAAATNLLALLALQGFNMTAMAREVTIKESSNDVYRGLSSAVTNLTGELLASGSSHTERASPPDFIDLTQEWLYSPLGATFSINVRGSR